MVSKVIENEIDNLLELEAHRVFKILWDMTQNKEIVTKSFTKLAEDVIDDCYKCFSFTIISKVIKLIPLDWCVNPDNNGYVFIKETDYIKNKTEDSDNFIKNKKTINNNIIKNVYDSIITNYKKDKLNNRSFMYFFNESYKNHKDLDYDYNQIICLINSIVQKINKNYKILNFDPLFLEEKI